MQMTLAFLGATGTVTGSKYLLTLGSRRILVDAGMYQGEKAWREKNWEGLPVDVSTIGDVLLTHAHADHSTYLPALVKAGFSGTIWANEPTIRLAEIVLKDAGKLQEMATKDANEGGYSKHEPALPLYTVQDVEKTLTLFREIPTGSSVDLGDEISATWVRSAHILGSCSITVSVDDEPVVLFSGDLGRHDHPILKPRETPQPAPYVVMESTYGDREHPEPERPHQILLDAITKAHSQGGQVFVPAFAIDRVEVVLQALVQFHRDGLLPKMPVYVDGPMALSSLDVYESSPGELKEGVTTKDFTGLPVLRETRTGQESKAIAKVKGPAIIISSSGMVEGGRILYHLQRGLPDPRNVVVLTGYQAEGTRGRALMDGEPQVKINGRYVPVRATVVYDNEFSVHGDASDLVDWARELGTPECIFVTHGEPSVAKTFATRLHDELGLMAVVPHYGEIVSLVPGSEDPEDYDLEQPPAPDTAEPDGE